MAKLYLKFDQSVLKEVPLTQAATTIGRLPDNTLQIDNLAVSGHHAKVYWNDGHYVIEDLGSLNGTYVNNKRVGQATLIHGDQVLIGKHVVEFKNEGSMALGASAPKAGPAAPKLDATVVLDTRKAQGMIAEKGPAPAARSVTGEPVPSKDRIGLLNVLEGKTDQRKYVLTGKMTMIGKSDMATIKLKGLFAPASAALISKRDGKYFIAPSEKRIKLKVNGEDSPNQRELNPGDVIEVGKFRAEFSYQD
ncbi:MAG TPA: FHA domain-containing protein [Candidatus Angelobacter sp.]